MNFDSLTDRIKNETDRRKQVSGLGGDAGDKKKFTPSKELEMGKYPSYEDEVQKQKDMGKSMDYFLSKSKRVGGDVARGEVQLPDNGQEVIDYSDDETYDQF